MRSFTRAAEKVRAPLLVLALTLAACSTATGAGAPRPADDHRTDVGEKVRANAFGPADHTLDAVENQKGGAFSH
jgi:hypothetical protein